MVSGRACAHPADVPLQAALDLAALRTRPRPAGSGTRRAGRLSRGVILGALAVATLTLLLSSTNTLGATLVTPKCDDVNLRASSSTTATRKTQVDQGARLTVVAMVSGGAYRAYCAGGYQSGTHWFKFSAINGTSVKSLYGVSYLYGARQLFKTLVLPTPSPTATPTVAPTGPVTLGSSVTFYGRGYGHGVGLSQYGAQGRATDGQKPSELATIHTSSSSR